MIKSFLTLAIRNLLKRKAYSFINIFGLAIGVAVCLIILKYVDFEMSYDRFHTNAETIYRTTTSYYQGNEFRATNIVSGYAQGPAMLADIPEVKNYVRTHPMYGGAVISYKREDSDPSIFQEEDIQFVDSTFFDVFTYHAVQGSLSTALDKPNSIVITKKAAARYFKPDEDPLGKVLQISGGWSDGDYEVTAVLEGVPENSHFTFDFLLPVHNLLTNQQYKQDDGWGWNNFVTYIQLHDNVDVKTVDAKIPALVDKYRGKDLKEWNGKVIFNFQPLLDIHLTTGLSLESSATISPDTIYFFIIISIFILAIAWVNYINLSTARAMERAREVGIKKAVGAYKTQLMFQFIAEAILVNFLGVLLATFLAIALLPVLNEIVGKELAFDFSDPRFSMVLLSLFAVGSIISGTYPAFVLSSFSTTEVLKGKAEKPGGGLSLRKVLVVFQFASSLILIAGTFAIYRQVSFMQNQDKGLTMDQMLIVDGPKVIDRQNRQYTRERLITFKNELKKIPGVINVASSGAIPGGGYNWGTEMRRDGAAREENSSGSIVWVDPDFVDTYGIKVLSGKNFDISIRSDMESVLVNEAALKAFGLGSPEDALEGGIIFGGDTVRILGVLKNYHWNSLKTEHTPWLFKADTISSRAFSIHLPTDNIRESINAIEKLYAEMFPGNPFNYYFLDDFFVAQYKSEQQFAKIFSLFAALAIIIACLGLWGLASFTTTLKLKEISIRKVLGASTQSIMSLLSWQFMKLVLIACFIAIPLTWYGINAWLDNFAFRIGLGWELFVIPAVVLGLIALATVGIEIFRGSNTNPAKILRSE